MDIDEAVEKFKEPPTKLQVVFIQITAATSLFSVCVMLSLLYSIFISPIYNAKEWWVTFFSVIFGTSYFMVLYDRIFPEG